MRRVLLALTLACAESADPPASQADVAGDTASAVDTGAPDVAGPAEDMASPAEDMASPLEDTDLADPSDMTEPLADVAADDAAADASAPWTPAVYSYPSCSSAPATAVAGCVDSARLEEHLIAIVGSRFPGEPNHAEARARCRSVFEENGFAVVESPSLLGGNVVGTRAGTGAPDELVVVGAHIDGRRGCDSANGNGTGVAALLELASALPTTHRRTLVLACWDEGELGRAGATEHADDLFVSGAKVAVAFGLDALGFTDETPLSQQTPITSANFPAAKATLTALEYRGVTLAFIGGKDASGAMTALSAGADAVGLPSVTYDLALAWLNDPTFSDYQRSNHVVFWARGIPAVTATDTGSQRNPQHRCRQGGLDSLERIDLQFFHAATAAVAAGVSAALADTAVVPANPLRPACDVVAQDCAAGARCVHQRSADGQSESRVCIAEDAAPVSAGALCVRPNDVVGEDTCAKGHFCSFYGGAVTAGSEPVGYDRVCSAYCRHPKDCGAGELCVGIGSGLLRSGLCRPRCTLLATEACPPGQKCSLVGLTTGITDGAVCMPAGTLALGAACPDTVSCGPDATCLPTADGASTACRPACSEALPCPDALQCYGLSGGFGFKLLDDPSYGVCAEGQ